MQPQGIASPLIPSPPPEPISNESLRSPVSPLERLSRYLGKRYGIGIDMINQNRRRKATVLVFPSRPVKNRVADLKELRAELRCIEKAIRILGRLAAKTESK